MPSQRLLQPEFVQFNTLTKEEDGTNLAFAFLVVHEDEGEHLSGYVFAHDDRNSAGLTDGVNWRDNVGKGGPGIDGSWSDIEEVEA